MYIVSQHFRGFEAKESEHFRSFGLSNQMLIAVVKGIHFISEHNVRQVVWYIE